MFMVCHLTFQNEADAVCFVIYGLTFQD